MGREEAAYTAIFPATLATAAYPVTVLSCGRKLHDRTATSVMTYDQRRHNMPPWQAGSGGRDSRSRQIKEDPRIGPFLQQWKTREKNRDRSENLPDSQKDSKIDRKAQTQRPL